MKELLDSALVLKVGTSTIVHEANGTDRLDTASFNRIGQQIDEVVASGRGVILVTSGARKRLPYVGWDGVVNAWDSAIRANTKDFLFTDDHLDSLDRWRGAFDVARIGGVAIVNANDPELAADSSYRNNDILAATLAGHIRWLLGHHSVQFGMLSDVHGVLADVSNPDSTISTIDDLDAYRHLAGGAGTEGATGGMETKFEAARLATALGVQTWIAHGRADGVIHEAIAGQAGTQFTT